MCGLALYTSEIHSFIFNFLFVLAAIAFIVVGVLVKLGLDDVTKALESIGIPFSIAPILMIVVGSIVFVIAFFGCCGAIKESTCMLTTYAVILLVLLIAQIAVGIYAFIQTKDSSFSKDDVREAFEKVIHQYETDETVREAVDAIQSESKCCGATGPGDWNNVNTFPKSCCESTISNCNAQSAYKKGCSEDMYEFLKKSMKIIGIVIITIAAVELAGIAFITIGAVYLLDIEAFTITLNKTGIPFSLAPALLLTVGIVIFVIAFFGCCGAIKESSCLLITYAIILLILFLLQVAIGIYAFIQFKDSNNVDRISIEQGLMETMNLYDHNDQARGTFDTLQSQLKCCGVKGRNDWQRIRVGDSVPSSCCDYNPAKCYPSSAYTQGCSEVLYKFLHDSITIIGIVFVAIAVVELSGAISAICLSCSIV
ncbi:hypothetical protein RN001_012099 [Aquatica leii]|uniref:Tetraspanin n=1 Tax=Aquatica leii TaxID=1421715 RepID=A0AAN7PTX0_9COLE|nr:hypothetical protein RN001_012099 [Aquatica leii]